MPHPFSTRYRAVFARVSVVKKHAVPLHKAGAPDPSRSSETKHCLGTRQPPRKGMEHRRSYIWLVKKKNHHYVFQAYLDSWSTDGRISCLREGRVFSCDLKNVACERFFYRFHDLTPEEIQFIERVFIENTREPLKTLQRRYIALYSLPTKMKSSLYQNADSEYISRLDELICNGLEDNHQRVEDELLVFLKAMLAGNTEFYSIKEQAARFLYDLSVQFTRTKQVRESAISQLGETFNGCNVRRLLGVISDLVAMSIGQSLYIDRDKFRLVLIDNDTDTPFITAGQPIINIHATFDGKPPEKVEFFYPLSPRRAMLLLEIDRMRHDSSVSALAVNNYNILMIRNSHEQIFSNSEEYLSSLKSIVRSEAGGERLKI